MFDALYLVTLTRRAVETTLDSTEKASRTASAWTTTNAVEASRKLTEKAAFEKLVQEFGPFWNKVVARYKKTP